MSTPLVLPDVSRSIFGRHEISYDYPITAEMIDYIRWLADQDSSFPLTAGQVWMLYHEAVRCGRMWSDICEDLGLPVREDWT